MTKQPKRPRDTNQLAKFILDVATGEKRQEDTTQVSKNAAAVERGKLGGEKGGPARAEALSAERRAEIARRAAEKRWGKT